MLLVEIKKKDKQEEIITQNITHTGIGVPTQSAP